VPVRSFWQRWHLLEVETNGPKPFDLGLKSSVNVTSTNRCRRSIVCSKTNSQILTSGLKVGRRLRCEGRIRKGSKSRLKSTEKEVETIDLVVAQGLQMNQHDVSRRRNSEEFLEPTAQELARLIHRGNPGSCLSAQADERANRFARLLNSGSSLE
jgi:hypothetical protein